MAIRAYSLFHSHARAWRALWSIFAVGAALVAPHSHAALPAGVDACQAYVDLFGFGVVVWRDTSKVADAFILLLLWLGSLT